MASPVIVTRPARPGQRLADRLQQRGCDAVWWPAFDIEPAVDVVDVRARLRRLAEYDLALFVSAHAVQATAQLIDAEWPASTIVGAVGAGTRAAVLAELRGVERATIVAPNADDESGSEAFWRAWQYTRRRVRRALLLRAEGGRDWIIRQLRAEGATVDVLAVYRRLPHVLTIGDRERLHQWLESGAAPLTVVTSSEAVDTLLEQVRAVDGADGWLRGGTAVATHPRVAQRLHSAGFQHIETCDADDDAILRKLESIADRAAGSS